MRPANPGYNNTTMKMKYLLLFAAAMFTFGAPMADAAPKKKKKAKSSKSAASFDFSVKSADDFANERSRKAEAAAEAAAEAEALKNISAAERREEAAFLMEDTKAYIANQKKALKILRSVRNKKSASKAAAALEEIYGTPEKSNVSAGEVTALGTVVMLEVEESKMPVHQGSRSVASTLNSNINTELARIAKLELDNDRLNAVLLHMVEQQR